MTQQYLKGLPVDQVTQGRVAALYDLETWLTLPPEKALEVFDNIAREMKA